MEEKIIKETGIPTKMLFEKIIVFSDVFVCSK